MTAILNLAFALIAGLLMTRVVNRWHLPDVTAFLIAGVLIGPFVLGRLGIPGLGFATEEAVNQLQRISDVTMGFIAFSIGSEFKLKDLKRIGKQAFAIGTIQAAVASVLTDIALVIFHFLRPDVISFSSAITLGAIASATAPAATLMVVRQFKADGELTRLLLPIVALDDAVGLIIFAISFGIARAIQNGQISAIAVCINPIIEIIASLVIGAIFGLILTKLEALYHSNRNRTSLTIGFIFLMIAITNQDISLGSELEISFSPLLSCMMLGTVFCNTCIIADDIMDRADFWSQPLLAAFFVISGAGLKLSVFSSVDMILIGIVYILARSVGKYFGAFGSSLMVHTSKNVTKYLGFTLLPQAGVALGMCNQAIALGEVDGLLVKNIILFSVLIYELVGPVITKEALIASGDIKEKPKELLERRSKKIKEIAEKEERKHAL